MLFKEKAMRQLQLPTFSLCNVLARVLKENPDWSPTRLTDAELAYRQYLALCRDNPGQSVAPTRDADEVWHAHILHTKEYARDCEEYFGRFLHHSPGANAQARSFSRGLWESIGRPNTLGSGCRDDCTSIGVKLSDCDDQDTCCDGLDKDSPKVEERSHAFAN